MKKKDKGFSLVELIVVIMIMAVMVGIITPLFLGWYEKSKRAVDATNVDRLNRATAVYATEEQIMEEDIFYNYDSDDERLRVLLDGGYINIIPAPKMNDTEFVWSIPFQLWYSNIYEVNGNLVTFASYIFGGTSLDDYITTDRWTMGEDGLISHYGRLFLENPNDEYEISVKATLSDSEDNRGGYGILFDSKYVADNDDFNKSMDTGYILQFDRGVNGIKIEYRDGATTSKGGTGDTFTYRDSDLLPQSKDDPWWTETHDIKLDVRIVDSENSIKKVDVLIDGEVVIKDYEFESTVNAAENHTGFRSWHEDTLYESLEIKGY